MSRLSAAPGISDELCSVGHRSPAASPDLIARRSNIWRANGRIENGRRNHRRQRVVTRDDADEVYRGEATPIWIGNAAKAA